jgi:hypothetical protein
MASAFAALFDERRTRRSLALQAAERLQLKRGPLR